MSKKPSTQRLKDAKIENAENIHANLKIVVNDEHSFPFFFEEMGNGTMGEVKIKFGRSIKNDCLYFWINDRRFTLPISALAQEVFEGLERKGHFPIPYKLTEKGKRALEKGGSQ